MVAGIKRRLLPTGIQTFRTLREEDCYYVDKTPYIRKMVGGGGRYFLSRPRRFGKSLLVDTIKELFEGSEDLFADLDIHRHRNWSIRHPVLRLDFSGGNYHDPDWERVDLLPQLAAMEASAGITPVHASARARLRHLIQKLHARTGQRVVVLVDEYDKPILETLETPELARANRTTLRGLYSIIKQCDGHIRFTFLTGVSKFSQVSLFSDLNNLTDLTLDRRYAAVCGYTERDLHRVFAPELDGLDRKAIRDWYNGYSWRGRTVYNPYGMLRFFETREFRSYWFETSTPKFLIDTLLRRGVQSLDLERLVGTDDLLSSFDVDEMSTEALLFQTGYLTILDEAERHGRARYRLGYPNREVRQSLHERLLLALLPASSRRLADDVHVERSRVR